MTKMIFLPYLEFKPKNPKNTDKVLAYQTQYSGNFDIFNDEDKDILLFPQQRHCFATGIYLSQTTAKSVEWNDGSAVLVLRPRSGLALKYGIMVQAGEIDLDYPQEIKTILYNSGNEPVMFCPGDRIAQARWTPTFYAPGVEIKNVVRKSGFGST